ncbi:hypothetical protein ACSW9O_16135 (plasmid) [Clostridium perfringens]|nr:hypothetical protein [Clostridium perfringens]
MGELLKRKQGENDVEYIKRLVYGKLVYKTIDLDFSELSIPIFNKKLSSDDCRRRCYGLKFLFEVMDKEGINAISENEILKKIEEKSLELDLQRKKLQATKLELNRNQRIKSRRELFYENIGEEIKRLPLPEFKELPIKETDGEYLLCWADLHYGADFISENNVYSREECKTRLQRLAAKVKRMCEEKGINKLNIVGLGDDIQGILRISDTQINDVPVMQSVVEISRLIAHVLNTISSVCEVTYYHTMASNHSQTRPLTAKPDLIKEDLEYVIGNYIQDLVSDNERIKVKLSEKDYHSFNIAGQQILTLHGHQIKNIGNAIKDYSMQHRVFYDLILMGHLHGGQQISVGESENGNSELVIVPSIVGSDPYSDTLKKGSKSMAKLFKLEEGNGITENYTIVLN